MFKKLVSVERRSTSICRGVSHKHLSNWISVVIFVGIKLKIINFNGLIS
jgi:hypothetical protein